MVNSERDPFHRIYNYLLRLQDGGPILLPAGNHQRLRHVYAGDVVQAILRAIAAGAGTGHCYNISQDETVSMENFLNLLAGIAGFSLKISYLAREILEGHGLIPDCSPFSDPWMSELDNQRSKLELGMQYTPLPVYLKDIVRYYTENQVSIAGGYQRRSEELGLAQENGKHVS
jgi:nucleoside-diphosphate-sugar epimerase